MSLRDVGVDRVQVFLLAGELVKAEVPPTLMQLIAEGSGDDEEADVQLRRDAVETYMALLDTLVLPDVLVQTMSWVLGEYGYLSDTMTQVSGTGGGTWNHMAAATQSSRIPRPLSLSLAGGAHQEALCHS